MDLLAGCLSGPSNKNKINILKKTYLHHNNINVSWLAYSKNILTGISCLLPRGLVGLSLTEESISGEIFLSGGANGAPAKCLTTFIQVQLRNPRQRVRIIATQTSLDNINLHINAWRNA